MTSRTKSVDPLQATVECVTTGIADLRKYSGSGSRRFLLLSCSCKRYNAILDDGDKHIATHRTAAHIRVKWSGRVLSLELRAAGEHRERQKTPRLVKLPP